MTKQDIHQRFIDQLTREVETITAAAKSSFDTATNAEHQAKSKYDTFSLETSYLARGQAKRVEELNDALERLQQLPLKALDATTPILLSALVRLRADDGETRALFLGSAAGGEMISVDGEEIIMVTARAPLGQAVLGKTVGDTFDIKMGIDTQTFTVVSVE
ncbi:MAG: transcription elongation factor GreAB [Verrucomicrobia bacterium]|jgi:transcription elongation GreA/GreB family factor|nr:transcription elongation factor GreAB [Verrucomicrobiota bacterium]MBT7067117.1 transcription elongation factor GreAB [Verrucomicrobiota bacterium]MBT7699251.1 transcription elongation factor GreAB [Verrucomicrobiota bacterium]